MLDSHSNSMVMYVSLGFSSCSFAGRRICPTSKHNAHFSCRKYVWALWVDPQKKSQVGCENTLKDIGPHFQVRPSQTLVGELASYCKLCYRDN